MFNIIIIAVPVTARARAGQVNDGWCGCVALDSAVINFKTKFNSLSLVSQSQANVFLLDKNPIFLVHLFPLHILATESVKFQHNLSTTIFLTSPLSHFVLTQTLVVSTVARRMKIKTCSDMNLRVFCQFYADYIKHRITATLCLLPGEKKV